MEDEELDSMMEVSRNEQDHANMINQLQITELPINESN